MRYYIIQCNQACPEDGFFYVNKDISLRWRKNIVHLYTLEEIADARAEAESLGLKIKVLEIFIPS